MGALAFDGQQLVMAFFDRVDLLLSSLKCFIASNGDIQCGDTYTVTSEKLGVVGDQVEPGAYPSIVISDGRAFIAHQQGETKKRYLMLSSCSLGATETSTLSNCSTQIVAQRTGSRGLGFLPKVSLMGQGTGAKLWFSFLGSELENSAVKVYSAVKSCTVLSASVDCSGPLHFDHQSKYTMNDAIFISRGHYVDPVKKIMIIPQATGKYDEANKYRPSVLSLGLPAN